MVIDFGIDMVINMKIFQFAHKLFVSISMIFPSSCFSKINGQSHFSAQSLQTVDKLRMVDTSILRTRGVTLSPRKLKLMASCPCAPCPGGHSPDCPAPLTRPPDSPPRCSLRWKASGACSSPPRPQRQDA